MRNSDSSGLPGTSNSGLSSSGAPKTPSWLIVALMLGIVGIAFWQNHHATQSSLLSANAINASVPEEDSPTAVEFASEGESSETASSTTNPNRTSESTQPAPKPKRQTTDSDKRPISLRPSNTKSQIDPRSKPDAPSGRVPSNEIAGNRNRPSQPNQSNNTKATAPDRTRPTEKEDESSNDETSFKVENQTIRDLNGRVVFKGTIDLKPTLDRIERGEENRHRNDGATFQNRENRLPRKPIGYYKEYVHPTKGEYGPGPQRIILGKEGEIWYTSNHYKSFKQIK